MTIVQYDGIHELITRIISCYTTQNQRGLQNNKPSLAMSCSDRFILSTSSDKCSYRSLRVLYPVITLRIEEGSRITNLPRP